MSRGRRWSSSPFFPDPGGSSAEPGDTDGMGPRAALTRVAPAGRDLQGGATIANVGGIKLALQQALAQPRFQPPIAGIRGGSGRAGPDWGFSDPSGMPSTPSQKSTAAWRSPPTYRPQWGHATRPGDRR